MRTFNSFRYELRKVISEMESMPVDVLLKESIDDDNDEERK
jgi:hypothetical protein